jgi:hypothetical protein
MIIICNDQAYTSNFLDESLPNLQAQIIAVLTPAVGPHKTAAFLGGIYGRAEHAKNTAGNKLYFTLLVVG